MSESDDDDAAVAGNPFAGLDDSDSSDESSSDEQSETRGARDAHQSAKDEESAHAEGDSLVTSEEEEEEEEEEEAPGVQTFAELVGWRGRSGASVPEGLVAELVRQFGAEAAPTTVQQRLWAVLLSNGETAAEDSARDVVAVAKTGSGKTLAFLVPLLTELHRPEPLESSGNPQLPAPRGVVLSPTRELAYQTLQVGQALVQAVDALRVEIGSAVGGEGYSAQQERLLSAPPDLVIGTPGRLLSLCGVGAEEGTSDAAVLSLERVQELVVDEADRILSAGFASAVEALAPLLASARPRVTLTSATWSTETAEHMRVLLAPGTSPTVLMLGQAKPGHTLNRAVTQYIEVVKQKGAPRYRKLLFLLRERMARSEDGLVVVFVLHKAEAKQIAQQLEEDNVPCVALHGDMSQQARNAAVAALRDEESDTRVLVATDVAARGLDVPGVSDVVNYSFPMTVDAFIHRCGRTARGVGEGRGFGTAHTFLVPSDAKFAPDLLDLLERAGQQVPVDLRILAEKELRRRKARAGVSSPDAPEGATAAVAPSAAAAADEQEEARRANRERQLKQHQARMAKQHAGQKRRGRRGRR